jgi:hypothetical protein
MHQKKKIAAKTASVNGPFNNYVLYGSVGEVLKQLTMQGPMIATMQLSFVKYMNCIVPNCSLQRSSSLTWC